MNGDELLILIILLLSVYGLWEASRVYYRSNYVHGREVMRKCSYRVCVCLLIIVIGCIGKLMYNLHFPH